MAGLLHTPRGIILKAHYQSIGHWTEQDDALARRKEIYEELYPETKQNSPEKQKQIRRGDILAPGEQAAFTKDAVEKTGRSQRSIQRSIHRSTNIDPALKPREKRFTKSCTRRRSKKRVPN